MTIIFGKTIPELTEHLNYRNHRQEVISSNIANVDTPGYKAKETLFEKELESRLKLTTTDPDHVNKISRETTQYKIIEDPFSRIGNDSNTVDIDREMMKLNQNQILYDITAEIIARKFPGLKSLIDSIK